MMVSQVALGECALAMQSGVALGECGGRSVGVLVDFGSAIFNQRGPFLCSPTACCRPALPASRGAFSCFQSDFQNHRRKCSNGNCQIGGGSQETGFAGPHRAKLQRCGAGERPQVQTLRAVRRYTLLRRGLPFEHWKRGGHKQNCTRSKAKAV